MSVNYLWNKRMPAYKKKSIINEICWLHYHIIAFLFYSTKRRDKKIRNKVGREINKIYHYLNFLYTIAFYIKNYKNLLNVL